MSLDPDTLTRATLLAPTLLGVTGFVIYAGADIALCLRRLSSDGVAYYILSGVAASLIGVSLLFSFNLGAFLTEVFCLATSLVAIAIRVRARAMASHRTGTTPPPKRPGFPVTHPALSPRTPSGGRRRAPARKASAPQQPRLSALRSL